MYRRVNPIMLIGLILIVVLSVGVFAGAQLGGGAAADAVGVGEAQLGKPFQMATDGPGTFSCSGLMRYILRTTGVDGNAPWVPEEYLSRYTPVDLANLQPGDIVIMPNWATMYIGNGMLLNANEVFGTVKHTPLIYAGTPLGAVRPPYLGSQSSATQTLHHATEQVTTESVTTEQPMTFESLVSAGPLMADPMATEQLVAAEPTADEPLAAEPLAVESTLVTEPAGIEPVATELPVQF